MEMKKYCEENWNCSVPFKSDVVNMDNPTYKVYVTERRRLEAEWKSTPAGIEFLAEEERKEKEVIVKRDSEDQKHAIVFVLSSWFDNDDD